MGGAWWWGQVWVSWTFLQATQNLLEMTSVVSIPGTNPNCISLKFNRLQIWKTNILKSSSPGQNGRIFVDDIFKCIFKFCWILFLKAPVTQEGHHAATTATYEIHQIAMWSPDIRKTPLCVTPMGTAQRSHGALTGDLCELNGVSSTTSASVRRSYHDLTAPKTRARCDHRRPSAIRMRPNSDATTT